jgi:hypothetical protein
LVQLVQVVQLVQETMAVTAELQPFPVVEFQHAQRVVVVAVALTLARVLLVDQAVVAATRVQAV